MTEMVTLPRAVVQDAAWALETLDYESTDETRRAASALRAALAAHDAQPTRLREIPVEVTVASEHGGSAPLQPIGLPLVGPDGSVSEAATLMAQRDALLAALYLALPFVEDHEMSDDYKRGVVLRAVKTIKEAIDMGEGR